MLTEMLSEILKTFAVTAGTYKYTSGIMFIYWHYIQMQTNQVDNPDSSENLIIGWAVMTPNKYFL